MTDFSHLWSRRDVLKVGGLSVAASAVPAAANANPQVASADSVIFLWMGGGVTHIDSFDPKPEAPEEVRGTLTAIPTSLPGVAFCEVMPHMARMAHEISLIRSFSHDSNDHLLSQVYTLSGRKVGRDQLFTEPNLGSLVSYLHGPRNGLPGYIAVPGITRPGPPPHNFFIGGWLGNAYAPFCVGGQPDQPDFTVGDKEFDPSPSCDEDLRPKALQFGDGVTSTRLDKRAQLKTRLEEVARRFEGRKRWADGDAQYRSALDLLLSTDIRDAFDVSKESVATRDRYGVTKIGNRCLMARRLVEAGARFVVVDYGYDPDYGNLWDNHNAPSQNMPHISKMCERGYHVAGIDRAFAGLIGDLKDRGRLDRTLVVFLTEFGRTPKINARGGRDHWGACGSAFFAGGGVRAGQVIGASDAQAAYPVTHPYSPADIAVSTLTALGISPDTRVHDQQNRPVPVLDAGVVIPGLYA